jgi:prophage maintenance system killer protein
VARSWWYPTAADIAVIVERLSLGLADAAPRLRSPSLTGLVRDAGLLDSALSLPRQRHYRTTLDKAGARFRSMVKNHPFADGNKRIGVLAAMLFLSQNGYVVTADNAELLRFTMELAASERAVSA